jgi:hypothetical protein
VAVTEPDETQMTERIQQAGDGEFAVCHVCARQFETQKDLDVHLMSDHEGELLADDQPRQDS